MSDPIPLFLGQCGCCHPCQDITILWMMHNARKNMPGWLPWADGASSDGRTFNQAADFLIIPDTVSYLTRTETLKYAGVIFCTRTITIDPLSGHISDTTGLSQAPNGGTFYRCIVISADGGKIASDYVFLQVL